MSPALVVHVLAGGMGILSGATALTVRKGGRLHRSSGTVFFASMLVMGVMATLLALTLPDWANLPGGVFTVYLVATGWATVRRSKPHGRMFDYGALAIGTATVVVGFFLAVLAHLSSTGLVSGKPAPLFAIFTALAAFAVALDVRVLRLAQLPSAQRLRRHVWRMCTALFIGTGSFFLGQQQVMPARLQGSPLLFVLALAPLAIMLLWLVRVRQWRPLNSGPVAP